MVSLPPAFFIYEGRPAIIPHRPSPHPANEHPALRRSAYAVLEEPLWPLLSASLSWRSTVTARKAECAVTHAASRATRTASTCR